MTANVFDIGFHSESDFGDIASLQSVFKVSQLWRHHVLAIGLHRVAFLRHRSSQCVDITCFYYLSLLRGIFALSHVFVTGLRSMPTVNIAFLCYWSSPYVSFGDIACLCYWS